MFELFYTHPYCKFCEKKIWIWQNGIRPSDAYHTKCLKIVMSLKFDSNNNYLSINLDKEFIKKYKEVKHGKRTNKLARRRSKRT